MQRGGKEVAEGLPEARTTSEDGKNRLGGAEAAALGVQATIFGGRIITARVGPADGKMGLAVDRGGKNWGAFGGS